MKHAVAVITLLFTLCCLSAVAQTSKPDYFLFFGGGWNEQAGITGAFGKAVADNSFVTMAVDGHAGTISTTGKRYFYTTARTGFQQVIAHVQTGATNCSLAVSSDIGATAGGNALVGAASGGGSFACDVPKHPNLFVAASYRAIKSPSQDPADTGVRSAFTIGIGVKLFK